MGRTSGELRRKSAAAYGVRGPAGDPREHPRADSTLADVERIAEESSATQQELQKALKSFAEASNAVRLLAEYLERHPEALVSGKNASGGK